MSKKDAAEKYFKLGEQKYNKKDYQGAIADLDKVIELNPKYFDAYNTQQPKNNYGKRSWVTT